MASDYEPFNLTENAEAEEEQRLRDRIKAEEFAKDIQFVMGDKRGRRFIWWLLGNTGLFRSSFTGTRETDFREGGRNIGLQLLDELIVNCSELYLLMERERIDDRRNADAAGKPE